MQTGVFLQIFHNITFRCLLLSVGGVSLNVCLALAVFSSKVVFDVVAFTTTGFSYPGGVF